MPEVIEMGDGLAHREKALVNVEFTPEEDGYKVGCTKRSVRLLHCVRELGKARLVVSAELSHTQRDAAKRQSVRRQHKRIRGKRLERSQRAQKPR